MNDSSIKSISRPFLAFCVFVLSIISIWVVFKCTEANDLPSGYEALFLLPLSFTVAIVIFGRMATRKKVLDNLPIVFLLILCFLRNVMTPYSMVTGSYVSSLGIASMETARKAIILVSYETIVIFSYIYLVESVRFKQKGFSLPNGRDSRRIFNTIFLILSIIAVSAIFYVPALRSHYYSFFTRGYMRIANEDYSYRGNLITRALGTAGEIAVEALRYIAPCYLFYRLAKKRRSLFHLTISLAFTIMQLFFMTDSNAYILMLMISQVLYIIRLYPKYRKPLTIGLAMLILMVSLLLYFNRFALNHYSRSLSLFLQSYVPGIANTAGVMNIIPLHNPFQIFVDFWVAIPFKGFLGISDGSKTLATMWKEVNNSSGQIMSTVGQSYYYFGSFLSPVLSCFLIQMSRKCNRISKQTDNALMSAAYIYLTLYSVCTPFVYNFCIYMQAFLQRIIFVFLVAYFSPYRFSDIDKQ